MQVFKRIILLASLLLLPVACTNASLSPNIGRPFTLSMTPPAGPVEYQQGWKDGCETGIAGYGNQFTKLFYKARKDANFIQNATYQRVWRDAYAYCRVYMKTTQLHGYGNYENDTGIFKIAKFIDG